MATNEGFIAGAVNTRFFEYHQQELLPPKKQLDLMSLDAATKRRLFSAGLAAFLIQSQHSSHLQRGSAKEILNASSAYFTTHLFNFTLTWYLYYTHNFIRIIYLDLHSPFLAPENNNFRMNHLNVKRQLVKFNETGSYLHLLLKFFNTNTVYSLIRSMRIQSC